MNFIQASISGFKNYAIFSGRSSRSEYWYFTLLVLLGNVIAEFIDASAFLRNEIQPTGFIWTLVTLLPWLAVACRRLHDVNRTGWWGLIIFTIIGLIPYYYWVCKKGDYGENEFGPNPIITEPPDINLQVTGMKKTLIVIGTFTLVIFVLIIAFVIWVLSEPESGVKLANEMDDYAVEYLESHNLLEFDELLIAYYDVTMSMDGTEAVILTDNRILYHKSGRTNAINIIDIVDIRHRYEDWNGDVFEVESVSGQVMKFVIAPLNQGETFKNILFNRWEKSKP